MAREHYEASLAIFERLNDELGIVTVLEELGEVAFLQGDFDTARSLLETTLQIGRRIDDKDRVAMALAALAGLVAAQGRASRALHLAAAATTLKEATGQHNSPAWHINFKRWLEPARRALTAESCAAAEAAGRAMSLDEAIEYALAADAPAADEPNSMVPAFGEPASATLDSREHASDVPASNELARDITAPVGRATNQLTQREREVAALVARGLTNRQIAEELVITEGTAASHVKHILARLTLDSRVQIAIWAIEHGLHRLSPSH